jgi:3'-5' exoribonuclease
MFVEEILKSQSNTVVEGSYLFLDPKLKPYNEREGHFLTFSLQDKTGLVWAKIWDNAEYISQQLKNASIVAIKGRTNVYNNKVQVIVDKIKIADENSYKINDIIRVSTKDPEEMWTELNNIMTEKIKSPDFQKIWLNFIENEQLLEKFKLWPGGKGTVHHAYQHGLLEHTLSIVKLITQFSLIEFDIEKALIGSLFHDIGKIEAYIYDKIKTTMSNIGRLHEHTVLSYFIFREIIGKISTLNNEDNILEEIGHIILSHHGTKENRAVVKPMTIEAKLVAIADAMDADANYMLLQLKYNADENGWVFDSLTQQFFFKRPRNKRRKLIT